MTPPWTAQTTVDLVAAIRNVADHIERLGPNCLSLGSRLFVNTKFSEPTPGLGMCSYENRPLCHLVDANIIMTAEMPGQHPKNGLKPAKSIGEGVLVRWDGQPPRGPKKGEYYNAAEEPCINSPDIYHCKRARKTKFFIYEPIQTI